MTTDASSFTTSSDRRRWTLRQAAIWTCFGFLYAAPCYEMAMQNGYAGPVAAGAMLLGVLTMIALVTTLTSTPVWERCEKRGLLGKALSVGRILRAAVAFLVLMTLATPGSPFGQLGSMDFLSGMFAAQALDHLPFNIGPPGTFWNTYLMTILTGCGVLLTLSAFTFGVFLILKLWRLPFRLVRPNADGVSANAAEA